jgi:hypothetical protein
VELASGNNKEEWVGPFPFHSRAII